MFVTERPGVTVNAILFEKHKMNKQTTNKWINKYQIFYTKVGKFLRPANSKVAKAGPDFSPPSW